ncbi:putative transcription factor MYB-HB-like family [Lupinus albus]|uniref:Putative transcription factor MYB-HB-like family n=1 Tax=Lupinus albus TaxID=3870 RepID=A0A6A4Q5R6_LUPAL|nr:putative transcription factor MYB-HB-like family [Lupinus albus]
MPKPDKKLYFSEEDAATLIQRNDATTVLTLLQEIAHYPNSKIDWNELVKKSSTGISNAREYQMLWRHLAYRDALLENPAATAEPLDDDSDLECELEALPHTSADSVSEATACVKVMIASHMPSIPSSSTIEAPLTLNVPVSHSSRIRNECSEPSNLMQRMNIIFPVTVQRTPLPTVSSTEGIETRGLGGGNLASKRKRWSEEEDNQLRAAVQRWGEGNWETMAKRDSFTVKRTPPQLSQRWTHLRKKDGCTTINAGTNSVQNRRSTAEQLAMNNAVSCALDPPSNTLLKKFNAPGTTNPASFKKSIKSPAQPTGTTEAPRVRNNLAPTQNPSQKVVLGSCDYPAKSKSILEETMVKCKPTPESTIKANTVASETQIVSSLNTVSQFKVAQTTSSLAKPTIPVALRSNSKLPNVHTDSSVAPALVPSKSAAFVTSLASCSNTIKSVSCTLKNSPVALSRLSEQDKHVTSVVNKVPLQLKQEAIITEFKVPVASPTTKVKVQADETSTITTNNHHMLVNSNLNKGRQDMNQDKNTKFAFQ